MELDYVATDTGSDGYGNGNGDGGVDRVSGSYKSKEFEFGLGACIGSENDWDCETKPRFSEVESENEADSQIERWVDSFEVKDEEFDEKKLVMASKEQTRVPDYKTFLSEFDEYVASEKIGSGVSRALSYGFEMGDLVWGKVESHPWWPGYILNEAFASLSVRRKRRYGYVLVAFFGDSSYGWFDPSEIIPFEPHVAEKSQQTTDSSNFVKAVEEAMDEAGRRSALGLTCKCRNPRNFRAISVQGYFAVDVIDYELQAVYSSEQIKKARDSFSSAQALSFVKRCALAPQECDTESVRFLQKKAAVCAFRRAVFEEFDETYEEAFRARSAYTSSVKTYEPINKTTTHSRAPLSGSLVMAETRDDPKSSRKVKDSTKQDKYLPKRKEEADDMIVKFGQVQATSQLQGINGSSAGDHVLQRRTPYLQTPMKHEQIGLVSMNFTSSSHGKETSVSMLSLDNGKRLAQESKVRVGEKAALFSERVKFETVTSLKQEETGTHPRSNCSAGDGIKKVNVLKRFSREIDSENAPSNLKMKKRRKEESRSEPNRNCQDKRKTLFCEEDWSKKSSQLGSTERYSSNTLTVRNSKLYAPQLLSSLQALSLDPFSGSSDTSSIRAVKQFFLRFRSLNYQKSYPISPSPTTKPSKTLRSTNEPSKVGRKRLSSDHQQDISSTKKLKKTIQLITTMPCDKKTNQEEKKRSNLAPLKPARDERGKKMAPSGKITEPTMLVMKFPHGTSLPSTALLKARFGRFGLLDQSAVRVLWKSSICRVVFLYKLDAQTALRYASGNHSLFGNVNVTYSLRDVKASSASDGHELMKKAKTDDERIVEPLNQRVEREQPVHQPNIQLKSCLKEPGNGNRGKARVRFMLGGKETGTPFPVSRKNNGKHASPSSSVVGKNYLEPPLKSVDISEEMMKLLLRCNDVVAKVTGLLGYVPYHLL